MKPDTDVFYIKKTNTLNINTYIIKFKKCIKL